MDEARHEAETAAVPAAFPSEKLANRPLTEPHPDRLSPDDPAFPQIIRAHAERCAAVQTPMSIPGRATPCSRLLSRSAGPLL